MELKEKIKDRMDTLQQMMESNEHIRNPEKVIEHMSTISKFWSVLSEEDRDYYHGAAFALEGKLPWG